jgi:hypothetical protein
MQPFCFQQFSRGLASLNRMTVKYFRLARGVKTSVTLDDVISEGYLAGSQLSSRVTPLREALRAATPMLLQSLGNTKDPWVWIQYTANSVWFYDATRPLPRGDFSGWPKDAQRAYLSLILLRSAEVC